MMVRRSRIDIMSKILSLAKESREGLRITEIIYGANLNYGLATRYLDMLLKDGLLSVERGGVTTYKITDKGLEALKVYRGLRDLTRI